ncbi:hypothetical protein [Runella aurantiaca]|uniref:Uncharacterized protein n=1 Tax=Runella aurantiaca TaxID=2282308 RepID=A0A369I877_9BACT|nr:hypothetical protein [Runella aurantiaca]RDB05959.1 hypothetical protein DVG78_11165 [Runella aurantiaca]
METSYKNISYFFVGILLCVLVGFHQTYTVKFPTFEGLSTAHHFHGAMLMAWFGMLIVQPLLIKYKKPEWHRQLGKVSYVLLPLVLFSIFWVTKVQYLRNISQMAKEVVIGGLALDIPNIVVFGSFYALAMVYRHRSAYHMRYMIGTSLLMIGPGIGRAMIIYGGIPFPVAIIYTMYFTELVAVVFLVLDYVKGRSIKPFAVILGGLVALHLVWNYQMSGWWQAFGGWFASVFF